MPRSGWFERRLLLALVLFSLIPALLLMGVGVVLLREAVSLQTTPAGWERLAESGQILLERAEASGDPSLMEAAARHRDELTVSVQQAQRWGYLNRRVLAVMPWAALMFFALVGIGAVRSARSIARGLAHPIRQLVDWSGRIGRGEALPERRAGDPAEAGEFGVLRESLRQMARELEVSRMRALETERFRTSVALARGVAHELKNALTPLSLAVRALQRGGTVSPDDHESLAVIEAEARRLEELARAFSQFGKPPEGEPSEVDIGELLEYLVRSHLPPEVESHLRIRSELPPVLGHYDALSRTFANLLLNSVEAMGGEGGRITIDAGTADDEGAIEIRIADSGPGIPAEVRDRLWDPAFSTKARGTGLGLALVRQTVHAHGGTIDAIDHSEGGAEFRILLPLAGTAGLRTLIPDS